MVSTAGKTVVKKSGAEACLNVYNASSEETLI
jgi:hypothetical protein